MSAGEAMDVTAQVSPASQPVARRSRSPEAVADVVLTVLLLALFGGGFLLADEWSFRAALFPRIVSGAGFALGALHLVHALLRWRREVVAARGGSSEPHGDLDPADPDDAEHLFRTAGVRRWAAALGWATAFFVLLYVGGLFVTAPVFSVLYLRFVGRRTWVFSGTYAVVIGALLYVAFEVALGVPTPPGLLLD